MQLDRLLCCERVDEKGSLGIIQPREPLPQDNLPLNDCRRPKRIRREGEHCHAAERAARLAEALRQHARRQAELKQRGHDAVEKLELQALESAHAATERDGERARRVLQMEVRAEGVKLLEQVGGEAPRRLLREPRVGDAARLIGCRDTQPGQAIETEQLRHVHRQHGRRGARGLERVHSTLERERHEHVQCLGEHE